MAAPPPTLHDRRERRDRRRTGERKGEIREEVRKGMKKKYLILLSLSLTVGRPTCDSLSIGAEPRVDVSRLDLRVGRILSIRRHPLAEVLTVQEVEAGETAPRTVVSKPGGETQLEEVRTVHSKYYNFIIEMLHYVIMFIIIMLQTSLVAPCYGF